MVTESAFLCLLIDGSFTDAVSSSECRPVGWTSRMINEFEMMWKEAVGDWFEICLRIGLERVRNPINQKTRFLDRHLNMGPPAYEAGVYSH